MRYFCGDGVAVKKLFVCSCLPLQEAYCNMLVKYREELARPIQEAAEFFKNVGRQLDSITGKYSFFSVWFF
jgi:hypothetical protein